MIAVRKVTSRTDIRRTARLAREIWRQHYVSIIGRKQTEYMLSRLQSAPAVARQMEEGAAYYLTIREDEPAGYFALKADPDGKAVLLSKIYVRQECRGEGMGKTIMEFAEDWCAAHGAGRLYLTVNRHNRGAIAFYRRMGFRVAAAVIKDIGNGFVMDDYRMVKRVRRTRHGNAAGNRRVSGP